MIPRRTTYNGQSYKLFDEYNDIHIFIEDEGFENLYIELFKKKGIKTAKIFSLNGKDSVLDAAELSTDQKCVYIVDRDWDDFHDNLSTLANVVVLEMHSIECYLIDYMAFYGVVVSENPKGDIGSKFSESDYENIILNTSNLLRPLFKCFVSLQLEDTSKKGCSHKPGFFQQQNRTCAPDEGKINNFITNSNINTPQSVSRYFSDSSLITKGHGKYMLHYVWEGVRNKADITKIGLNNLMIRLAQLVDTDELTALSQRIVACGTRGYAEESPPS